MCGRGLTFNNRVNAADVELIALGAWYLFPEGGDGRGWREVLRPRLRSMIDVEACIFFSSRRRHTRCGRDWSSDVCSSDLIALPHVVKYTQCNSKQYRSIRNL